MVLATAVQLNDIFKGQKIEYYSVKGSSGFTGLISDILPTFWVVAGFILFIYMIVGGFMVISSSGDAKKADAGKEALTNAIIGFVIIFASYWIVQIIEVVTGVGILK